MMRKRSKKTTKLYWAERVPLVKRLLSETFNCAKCGGRSELEDLAPRELAQAFIGYMLKNERYWKEHQNDSANYHP